MENKGFIWFHMICIDLYPCWVTAPGRYRINGREVSISLVTRETKEEENPGDSVLPSKCPSSNMAEVIEEVNQLANPTPFEANPDDLIVRDGPLTQPFLDYVFDTGASFLVLSWSVVRWSVGGSCEV